MQFSLPLCRLILTTVEQVAVLDSDRHDQAFVGVFTAMWVLKSRKKKRQKSRLPPLQTHAVAKEVRG